MAKILLTSALIFFGLSVTYAQVVPQKEQKLRFYLNNEKSTYLGFAASGQIWLRYTNTNPGTTVNSKPESSIADISIRRLRLKAYGQLSNRLSFVMQVGMNNLNYITGSNNRVRFLDAYATYKFSDYLNIGAGKTAFAGLARMTSPSTSNTLGVDIPVFGLSTVNISDDLTRKLSLFAHGTASRFNYRLVVSKPFLVTLGQNIPLDPAGYTRFANGNSSLQTSGYVNYNFLDHESQTGPFFPGSYWGSKKILNIGAGFMHQSDAMVHLDASGEEQFTDMAHFAVDLFWDMPLCRKNCSAITLYATYYNYNFGQDYIRNIGVNNPANGISEHASFNLIGNAFPAIGTGEVMYMQVGYTLPEKRSSENITGKYQIYAGVQHAKYDRLVGGMNMYEAGVSYKLNRFSKFTFGYQNRPIFDIVNAVKPEEVDRKGMFVLQYQFKIN